MYKKAIIFLANGFEDIEAVSCIDILRRANINVTIAGIKDKEIKGARGTIIITDKKLDEVKNDFDAYILPGGSTGAKNLSLSQEVTAMIKDAFKNNKIIAAVCASPAVVLGQAGILENKTATCYPGMQEYFPSSAIYKEQNVVIDGNLITSRGPATAILFALAITEKLVGKEITERIKKDILL